MGRRVLLAFSGVSSPGNDGMLTHEYRPHGNFAVGSGLASSRSWFLLAFSGVSSPGNDGMLTHEYRPHGNFAVGSGLFRFQQRFVHEGFIGRWILLRRRFEAHTAPLVYTAIMVS